MVPTKRLVEWVWGYDDVPPAGAALLKSHLSHLRRKLGLPGKGRGGIRNVAGVGYQLSLSG